MYCINCGAQIPENSRFCPNCGKSVIEEKAENKGNERTNPFVIIGAAFFLLTMILTLMMFVTDNNSLILGPIPVCFVLGSIFEVLGKMLK